MNWVVKSVVLEHQREWVFHEEDLNSSWVNFRTRETKITPQNKAYDEHIIMKIDPHIISYGKSFSYKHQNEAYDENELKQFYNS